MTPIILLCGQANSGKDTFAELLSQKFSNVKRLALVTPMKEFMEYLFELSKDNLYGPSAGRSVIIPGSSSREFWDNVDNRAVSFKTDVTLASFGLKGATGHLKTWVDYVRNQNPEGVNIRSILQSFGDWSRTFNPNIWIDKALEGAERELADYGANLVILTDGRRRNEILRAAMVGAKIIKIKTPNITKSTHLSETDLNTIPSFWFDTIIHNDLKSMAMLEEAANVVKHYLIEKDNAGFY